MASEIIRKRELAFIIDFFLASTVNGILSLIFLFTPILDGIFGIKLNILDNGYPIILSTFISALYFIIRDILGGKSIGKKFMKLEIVYIGKNTECIIYDRILRNITLIFLPLEIVVFLMKGRRLGDFLAKTDVVLMTDNPPL